MIGAREPYYIVERIRVSQDEFERMPVQKRPDNLYVPPETLCKVLIGGKWHACDRQYQFGQPVHFARPITVVLKTGG